MLVPRDISGAPGRGASRSCVSDPASAHATSTSSSTCHRRRRLRRWPLRPRRSYRHRSKRAVGVDAGEGAGTDGGTHIITRSKDKAPQTSASVHAPRPSQEARDRQRHGAPSTILALEQGQAGGSRDAQGQHARQHVGASAARSPGRDVAPSNTVRSLSISRSSHRSPPPPKTPEEALARAQLLLDYPPAPDKIDDWRATIQSLIGFANGDTPR